MECPVCLSTCRKQVAPAGVSARNEGYASVDAAYFRCARCRCVYVHPFPSSTVLDDEYCEAPLPTTAPSVVLQATRAAWGLPTALPLFRNISYQIEQYMDEYARGVDQERILDVGCGDGHLARTLLGRGRNVFGVDLSARKMAALERACPGRFFCQDFMGHEPERRYTTLYSNQVLEHIVSPHEFIARASSMLVPDGLLMFITPNADGLDAHAFRRDWVGLWYPQHVVLYGKRSATALLEAGGFEVIEARTIASPGVSALSLRRVARRMGLSVDTSGFTAGRMERALCAVPALFSALLGLAGELCVVARVRH